MASQLWSRVWLQARSQPTGLGLAGVSARRGVTDIEYYKEVDQSHLHLVQAQSEKRKFLLQLRAREAWEERRQKRLLGGATPAFEYPELTTDQPSVAGYTPLPVREPTVYDSLVATAHQGEPCQPGPYIERTPTTVLNCLAGNVGHDFTAPDYRYHDDPYLIPYHSTRKRQYMMAKQGGKSAARYVLDRHPELFNQNLIESVPKIQEFMPRAIFDESQANVELLKTFVAGHNVEEATQTYMALLEKGETIDSETLQSFLELLAFNNGGEAKAENHMEYAGAIRKKKDDPSTMWPRNGLVERLAAKMDPMTPETRLALLLGADKYFAGKRANEMIRECKTNQVPMNVDAYNAAIRSSAIGMVDLTDAWGNTKAILNDMVKNNVHPNTDTLDSILKSLAGIKRNTSQLPQIYELAFNSLAEFKAIGVPITLSCYTRLIVLFKNGKHFRGDVVNKILDEIENKEWSPLTLSYDLYFFPMAMTAAMELKDMSLGYRIHELLMYGDNAQLLNDFGMSMNYYSRFLDLILLKEPFEVTMEYVSKFTPNVFAPNLGFYESLLERLRSEAAFQFIPKIWTDLSFSSFCGVKKTSRTKAINFILGLIVDINVEDNPDMKELRESTLKIARDAFTQVSEYPDDKREPIDQDMNIPLALDKILTIGVAENDGDLVMEVAEFCLEWSEKLMSPIEPQVFDQVVDILISYNARELEYRCIKYCAEKSLVNGVEISKKICSALSLKPQEKIAINQLFAHDVAWTPLVI